MPTTASNPASDLGVGLKAGPSEPTEDVQNFDEAALADKISDSFAAAFGTDDDDPQLDDATPDDVDVDGDDDGYQFQTELDDEQDEEPDGSAADDDYQLDDASDGNDDGSGDAPTIPTAHERSLLANHTRQEIQQLHKSLGADGFADYAARAHEKRNAETARMAELGRMAQQFGTPQQPTQVPAADQQPHQPTQQQGTNAPLKIEQVSVDALREKFGDDELIDTFAKQMNAQASVLNQMMAQQQQSQQQLIQQEQEALARRVEEFFGGKELEAFAEHYGNNASALTPEQQDARLKVLEMADALSAGAQFQGRSLTVQEALNRAHSALSVDVSEATVRNKIKKEAKRRNRGLTTRPNARRKASSNPDLTRKGQPSNERELQARTRARLKQVFG